MTREEIINGLKMSMDLTLFDPSTGEVMEPRQLNDINRTAYEAYKGAIELLEKQSDTTTHDSIPAKSGRNGEDRTTDGLISRRAVMNLWGKYHYSIATKAIEFDKELRELPSAQPEPCKDAVSREAVLSMIDTYMNKSVELHYLPTSDGIKKLISILPSAQPERKTGRWIPTASGKGRHECSRCHEYAPCYQDGSEHLSTFCVLCGAKMERGEEE